MLKLFENLIITLMALVLFIAFSAGFVLIGYMLMVWG